MRAVLKNVVATAGFSLLALSMVQWRTASAYEPNAVYQLTLRVRELEDVEAIKALKHRYMVAIDDVVADPGAAPEFVALFTDDFTVQYDQYGTYTDKPALQAFLVNAISPAFTWSFHAAHNPRIEVTGNTATAEWYFTGDAVIAGTYETTPYYGRYVDEYVRTCDGWKIHSTILTFDSPPT